MTKTQILDKSFSNQSKSLFEVNFGGKRFMLGLNTTVKPGVIALSDHVFIFVCGNNIVIHNTIEKTQKYIPGIDGTQGISTM
jgi:hypothetical protein